MGKRACYPQLSELALLQIRLGSPPLQPQTFPIRRERGETDFPPLRFCTSTGVHCHTPIPSSCYPSPHLNSPPRSRNSFQTSLLVLLESLIGCYKLETLDSNFLLLLLSNGIWESHVQPTDWQLYLMQPIYKGHDKDKTDPASYRGTHLGQTV